MDAAIQQPSQMTFRYRPGEHPAMRVFHTDRGLKTHPLLAVATAVFQLEKALRRTRVETAEIELMEEANPEVLHSVAAILQDLVRFSLVEEVDFLFNRTAPLEPRKIRSEVDLAPADQICLFSGGVDSYVGLLLARQRFANVNAVFCAHHDQSKINRIVRDLYQSAFGSGPPLRLLSIPGIGKQGYAQTRGFLYFVSAAAWMYLLGASTLIVTECGPTMYQPKFGPLDKVTLTTHPYVVASAKRVIEFFLGREIRILTPFENLTKAEVMTLGAGDAKLELAHSCISQRFGTHDGTCYGCVVRRLAALAAGVRDTEYRSDPLLDERASRSNLLALLRYSLDYLADRGNMEEYEVGEIQAYRKEDLFYRFGLDNFAAVHRLMNAKEPVAGDVRRIYGYALKVLGGKLPLTRRLRDLETKRFKSAWADPTPRHSRTSSDREASL